MSASGRRVRVVGMNYGAVNGSYVDGVVDGVTNVGGIVGVNMDSMIDTHMDGVVSGRYCVGGLVGKNVVITEPRVRIVRHR